jgi:ribosomal protein S18 acetylase RimI-like enzyme
MIIASDIQIRIAKPGEASVIEDLICKAFANERIHYTKEAFEYTTPTTDIIRERILNNSVWVLESNNEIVATVSGFQQKEFFFIRSVAVHKKARRRGLARAMMIQMEEIASEKGCNILTLTTTSCLIPAVRLYESLGFRVSGTTDLYGTTLVKMVKRL